MRSPSDEIIGFPPFRPSSLCKSKYLQVFIPEPAAIGCWAAVEYPVTGCTVGDDIASESMLSHQQYGRCGSVRVLIFVFLIVSNAVTIYWHVRRLVRLNMDACKRDNTSFSMFYKPFLQRRVCLLPSKLHAHPCDGDG